LKSVAVIESVAKEASLNILCLQINLGFSLYLFSLLLLRSKKSKALHNYLTGVPRGHLLFGYLIVFFEYGDYLVFIMRFGVLGIIVATTTFFPHTLKK
jgi:hypothetical protein